MSKLYGSLTNERGKTSTRCAHRMITSHAHGWEHGIRATVRIEEDGSIVYCIYETGGTNGGKGERLIESGKFGEKES